MELGKVDLQIANKLWKKYTEENNSEDEYDEWYIIDSYIRDGRLIDAIKEHIYKTNI